MATTLVVDDDRDTCRNRAELFDDLGYVIDTAEGGDTALEKARQQAYDSGLLDPRRPSTHGLTLCRRLKRLHPVFFSWLQFGRVERIKEPHTNVGLLIKPIPVTNV
jgi:CheY-like chemotaxis protein